MRPGYDVDDLRQRIEAGTTVAELAAERGITPRSVRLALRRLGVPLPSDVRRRRVNWAQVERDWRDNMTVSAIAHKYGITENQVRYGVRQVAGSSARRAQPRYARLRDASWLRVQLAVGRSQADIARQLGADPTTVCEAIARHGIKPPPRGTTPPQRIAALADPAERLQAAQILLDEAQATATEATKLVTNARRELERRR